MSRWVNETFDSHHWMTGVVGLGLNIDYSRFRFVDVKLNSEDEVKSYIRARKQSIPQNIVEVFCINPNHNYKHLVVGQRQIDPKVLGFAPSSIKRGLLGVGSEFVLFNSKGQRLGVTNKFKEKILPEAARYFQSNMNDVLYVYSVKTSALRVLYPTPSITGGLGGLLQLVNPGVVGEAPISRFVAVGHI